MAGSRSNGKRHNNQGDGGDGGAILPSSWSTSDESRSNRGWGDNDGTGWGDGGGGDGGGGD